VPTSPSPREPLELIAELVRGDGALGASDPEAGRAWQRDLGPHLDVKVEGERLALVELEIVDVRLRDRLQLLALEHFLVRVLHEVLEDFLTDGLREFLAHHRGRSLTGTEPGEPNGGRVPASRLLLGVADRLDGDRDLEESLGAFGLLGGDLDIHTRRKDNPCVSDKCAGWTGKEGTRPRNVHRLTMDAGHSNSSGPLGAACDAEPLRERYAGERQCGKRERARPWKAPPVRFDVAARGYGERIVLMQSPNATVLP
jgi:hypothetical protein